MTDTQIVKNRTREAPAFANINLLEAAAKEYVWCRNYWAPLKEGCLCEGCGSWMPVYHGESHDHMAGCKYAVGDPTERQSPWNKPNVVPSILKLRIDVTP